MLAAMAAPAFAQSGQQQAQQQPIRAKLLHNNNPTNNNPTNNNNNTSLGSVTPTGCVGHVVVFSGGLLCIPN
jgi:hypothetical protein